MSTNVINQYLFIFVLLSLVQLQCTGQQLDFVMLLCSAELAYQQKYRELKEWQICKFTKIMVLYRLIWFRLIDVGTYIH